MNTQMKLYLELFGSLVVLCLLTESFHVSKRVTCRPLPESTKRTMLARAYTDHRHTINGRTHRHDFHESFYAVGACLSAAYEGVNNSIGRYLRPMQMSGAVQNCSAVPRTSSEDISAKSLCPWVERDDVDRNRYPRTLKTSACMCRECMNYQTTDARCKGIPYFVRVLRRTGCGPDGVEKWEPKIDMIYRGCACAALPN